MVHPAEKFQSIGELNMDTFDFNTPISRTQSLSVKWNRNAIASICNNADATPHWVADMDFPAPPAVLEALQAQVEHGVLGYPAFGTIASTFTAWSERRHNWIIDPSMVVPVPGMLASIATLVELYSQPGDGIVVPMPAYKPFIDIVRRLGRTLVEWPMQYNPDSARFTLAIDSLETLLSSPNSPILLFCSPHNPTGRVFDEQELDAVARIAARCATMVISDEIHADLSFPTSHHIPFDTVARTYGIACATCMAPSKTFNIAGEHFSIVVCSDQSVRSRLQHRLRALHIAPDLLATVTALAAYGHGYDWLVHLNRHLASQARLIRELLDHSGTGLRFVVPEASFIGLIDCTAIMKRIEADAAGNPELYQVATSPEGGILSRFFGQRADIAMNDGSWFGARYGNFVRFNYGTTKAAVEQAIEAMLAAVARLS
jgi:cystathionine beta-lyase